jgi:murein DD-endopeptidase MepM/ murein hydrolase activator NlpD
MKLQDIGKLKHKDIINSPDTPIAWLLFWVTIILILSVMASNVFGDNKIKLIRPFDDSVYPVVISGKWGASRTHAEGGHVYPHTGIDYKLDKGTPLRASYDGLVINAEDSETGYGNWVVIDHGQGVTTLVAHLWKVEVKEGQRVKQGDLIGRVGKSGRAFGYHAHYEVRVNGKPVHPAQFIF